MTQRNERALRRQLERYELRFNPAFWEFWDERIAPTLPADPVIVDVGPGPGLFLRDLSARVPTATLHGVDSNEAMIENAPRSCKMSSAAMVSLLMRDSANATSSGMLGSR